MEYCGMGIVRSDSDGEFSILPSLMDGWNIGGVVQTGVNWIGVTVLSSLAMVKAGSDDDKCEIVHHSPNGAVEGSRLKGSAAVYRNHRILTPGDVVTLGRPGERQIIITGRA